MRIYYSRKKVACYVVTSAARISLFFGQAHATSECFTTHYTNMSFSRINSSFYPGSCFAYVLGYLLAIVLENVVVQLSSTRKVMCIKTIIRNDERKLIWTTTMGIPPVRFWCFLPLSSSTCDLVHLPLSTRLLTTPTILHLNNCLIRVPIDQLKMITM